MCPFINKKKKKKKETLKQLAVRLHNELATWNEVGCILRYINMFISKKKTQLLFWPSQCLRNILFDVEHRVVIIQHFEPLPGKYGEIGITEISKGSVHLRIKITGSCAGW